MRAKVDVRAVLLKKLTGFCCMFVTAGLLRLGALMQDNLQMGAFSCWRFLFACGHKQSGYLAFRTTKVKDTKLTLAVIPF